jgi:hypothetical protein
MKIWIWDIQLKEHSEGPGKSTDIDPHQRAMSRSSQQSGTLVAVMEDMDQ